VKPRTMARKPETSMMTIKMISSQEIGMSRGSLGDSAAHYHDSPG
jgi:hypothetical protein